ncbi:MAG: glycosyltransferase family 4 protein [Novosphingobium sp.]
MSEARPLRVLHLHSTFSPGGKELRAAKLMNAFGSGAQHVVVSGVPGELGAASAVDQEIAVSYPDDFPSLIGKPGPLRWWRIARAMQAFDLVLTYNWGSMDAAGARWLYRHVLRLPPLIHHEDGFNTDEAQGLKPVRNRFRRLTLRAAAATIVPSKVLEEIALTVWRVPAARLKRIPNGIALGEYQDGAVAALPGLTKRDGRLWLGTMAGLRAVKNLPRLVRAFAALPDAWELVIVGEGPERAAIRTEAERLGIAERVHLPGFAANPAAVLPLFDLFALSSDSEQFPISVVEAMAAGLAVVSPAVGDVAAIVAPQNLPLIAPPGDEAALANALQQAAADPDLRAAMGRANRARALAEFGEEAMIAAYCKAYGAALGRGTFP